ncbi:TetR/AcrR family transcriptional regulator [Streptomyces sp. JNUCC 64]
MAERDRGTERGGAPGERPGATPRARGRAGDRAATRGGRPKVPDGTLWERVDRPAPAPRATLSPRRIAEAAVRIADAEGFQAVTMRRLATELGVAPMAAYRHVSGKDDLWALMVDQVSASLDVPAEVADWRGVIREMALRTRAMTLAHPWLASLPAPLVVLTPNRVAAAERQLAALDGHGLDADTLMAAFKTVVAFVHGSAQSEVTLHAYMAEQGWQDGAAVRTGLAPAMGRLLASGRYPTYERALLDARRKDDSAWEFEVGLDCVLDGLAARLGLP